MVLAALLLFTDVIQLTKFLEYVHCGAHAQPKGSGAAMPVGVRVARGGSYVERESFAKHVVGECRLLQSSKLNYSVLTTLQYTLEVVVDSRRKSTVTSQVTNQLLRERSSVALWAEKVACSLCNLPVNER